VNAVDVLGHLIDRQSWKAAHEIARWRLDTGKEVTAAKVLGVAALHGARPDVVLALTLGVIKRAVVKDDGSVGTTPHGYACVLDEATILNARDPATCAALAIWLTTRQSSTTSNREDTPGVGCRGRRQPS
jgi:hypothetical protein